MKKISALLFTLILLFSLFPATARAADTTISIDSTCDISTFDDGATVTINGGLSVTLTNTTSILYKDINIVCIGENTHITADNVYVLANLGSALKFTGAGNTLTLIGSSDFKALNNGGGIVVNEGTELTIDGEGSLEAFGNSGYAGIGGATDTNCGSIIILSGSVNANASSNAAAIGGGFHGSGGTIIIEGGSIKARTGGNSDIAGCAAIGGGYGAGGGTITITGGTIDARASEGDLCGAAIGSGSNSSTGSEISISGGNITATGRDSAGIGGGYRSAAGTIKIFGDAEVTATGGSGGAGIGGGSGFGGGAIDIYGNAKVTATGGSNGAAIGGGYSKAGGTIKIYGEAEVNATGGARGSGIGGGEGGTGGDITISGGTVTATGGGTSFGTPPTVYGGAGIGGGSGADGGNIKISGGTVTATGAWSAAGIGGGYQSSGGSVSIEGGMVFASGGVSGMDIGCGRSGSVEGTLSISGNSSVLFKNDSFPTPTTSLNYFPLTSADGDGRVLGVLLPAGWNGASGYLKNLLVVSYDSNGGLGSVPQNEICLPSSNYSFTADNGNDLTLSGHYLLKWNTVREGTGTDCLRGVTYSVNSNITLYAQWSKYVSGITLNRHSLSINKGDSSRITATVSPSDAYANAYWSSSDTQVAVVDQNGNVKGTGIGTATITIASYGASDSCTVTVSEKSVTSVSLNYGKKYLYIGDVFALSATVSPNDASGSAVTWKSSDTSVAIVTGGVVTAVGTGSCTITATAGGVSDTCRITVEYEPKPKVDVSSVNISVDSVFTAVLYVGDTMMLSANVSPSNADDASVTWESSNLTVAEVTGYGKVTAVAEGEATITVSAGEKTDSYKVAVKAIEGASGKDEEQSPELGEPTPSPAAPTPTVEIVYTIQIDTTSLPYGAQYIELPSGEIVELNGDDVISCEVFAKDLENGAVKIVALDNDKNALGAVDVSAETGGVSGAIILLIAIGTLILGIGGTLVVIRFAINRK